MKARNIISLIVAALCVTTLYAQTRTQLRVAEPNEGQADPISTEKVTMGFLAGVKEMVNGEQAKAAEIFNALAMLTTDRHTASLYYLAQLALNEEDLYKAEHYITRALKSDYDNTHYLKLLCDTYLQRDMLAQADSTIRLLLEIDSTDQLTNKLNVYATFRLGNKARAMELSNAYEQRYGFDRLVFECRKEFLIAEGRIEELHTAIEKAIASSEEPELLILKAQVLASMARDSAAIATYKLALRNFPSTGTQAAYADYWRIRKDTTQYMQALMPIVRDTLIRPETKVNAIVEAYKMGVHIASPTIQELLDTLTMHDNSQTVKEFMGESFILARQMNQALKIFQNIYELHQPVSERNLKLLIQLTHETNGDRNRLLELISEGIERFPEVGFFTGYGALVFNTPEDHKTALSLFNLALKTPQSDTIRSQTYCIRGDYYNQHKALPKAVADYKKAISLDPRNATAYNNYAYALAVAGLDLETALTMANVAVDIEPDNYTFIDTKAWVYYRLGRYGEAKTFIIRAVNLTKTPPIDILLHAGDIYNALNDSSTATYYWKWAQKEGATPDQIGGRIPKNNDGK